MHSLCRDRQPLKLGKCAFDLTCRKTAHLTHLTNAQQATLIPLA